VDVRLDALMRDQHVRKRRNVHRDQLHAATRNSGAAVGLERQEENPTVDLLDRIAEALSVNITDFFIHPKAGEKPPAPLKGGRRPSK
jgi:transcriptional regulator with XRE-family HTH domain